MIKKGLHFIINVLSKWVRREESVKEDPPTTVIGPATTQLDPFGDEDVADVKYRTMAWWQTGMVMIAETISLGILSLPSALSTLGLIPGIVAIIGLGVLSTYTGFVIGQLKQHYVQIHSMADAGEVLLGQFGREMLGAVQLVFFLFIMGSHLLAFSIMMNVLTGHSACTIIFAVVGLIVSLVLTLPQRLEDLTYISMVSFISIIGAVLITMIGVSTTSAHPSNNNIVLVPSRPQLYDTFLAISNITFAYAGHVGFFTFFSELKDIRDYPKALGLLQISEIIFYTVTTAVIYVFAGPRVVSPALNATPETTKKIAYGIAIPTIVIAGVVNAHVAVKYIYVRIFRGTDSIHKQSFASRGAWVLICVILWIVSWIIAESIPVFNDVLGLAGSLFASWFTFGLSGIFWIHLNRDRCFLNWRKVLLLGLNLFNIAVAITICIVGFYSSIKLIREDLSSGVGGGSFSCADNAGI